jgi:hypothetical protein
MVTTMRNGKEEKGRRRLTPSGTSDPSDHAMFCKRLRTASASMRKNDLNCDDGSLEVASRKRG